MTTPHPTIAPAGPPDGKAPGPLAHIRVLDLTLALAGPFCTMLLGGLGAEIIKIEAPGGSDIARENPPYIGPGGLNHGLPRDGDMSLSALDRHRSKRSITLDLKSDAGRALFHDLVRSADIVVENMSWGTAERLGLSYRDLARIKPDIILASISAMAGSSRHGDIKAMDIIVQALSGVMEINGFSDGPPCRVGFPLADLMSSHYGAIGILAALAHRARTGAGQHVQVNMLDSLVSLLALEHYDLAHDPANLRTGNHHERLAPFGVFEARDGYFAVAAPSDSWSARLFEAIGMPDMAADPRFASRSARARNVPAMNKIIEGWSKPLDVADAVGRLVAYGVSAVPVRSPLDAFTDPEILARKAVVPLRNSRIPESVETFAPGIPIGMSGCHVGHDRQAPLLGEDSDAVYRDLLGLSEAQIGEYRARGVI